MPGQPAVIKQQDALTISEFEQVVKRLDEIAHEQTLISHGTGFIVAALGAKSGQRYDELSAAYMRLLAAMPALRGILFKIMDLPDDEADKRGDLAREGMTLIDTVAPTPKTGE